jgi:hypothetical protein
VLSSPTALGWGWGTVTAPAVATAAGEHERAQAAGSPGREGSGGQARGAGRTRTRTRTGSPGAGRAERPGGSCGRQKARGCGESAGCGMGPPESAAELAAEAVELREPELQLADPASPGEEHVDVEAEGAPGRGRCWPCGAWACGSRGEPGECGRAGSVWSSAHRPEPRPRKFPSVNNPKLVTGGGGWGGGGQDLAVQWQSEVKGHREGPGSGWQEADLEPTSWV